MINNSIFRKPTFTVSLFAILIISASFNSQASAVLPTLVEKNAPVLNTYQPHSNNDNNNYNENENTNHNSLQTFKAISQAASQAVNLSKPITSYNQLPSAVTTLIPVASNVSSYNNADNPDISSHDSNIREVDTHHINSHNVDKQVMAYLVVVDANGREQLMPVTPTTRVKSGDVLEYQTNLTNTTPDNISSMTVSVTIPNEVELIGNVAPQHTLGSADGSSFQYMPIKAKIDGVVQDLPLTYYKSVRWNLKELNMNNTTTVSYRARYK